MEGKKTRGNSSARRCAFQTLVNRQSVCRSRRSKMLVINMFFIAFMFSLTSVVSTEACDRSTLCKCFRSSATCYGNQLFSIPQFTWRERRHTTCLDLRKTGLQIIPRWTPSMWPALKVNILFFLKSLKVLKIIYIKKKISMCLLTLIVKGLKLTKTFFLFLQTIDLRQNSALTCSSSLEQLRCYFEDVRTDIYCTGKCY